ncbi:ferric reductase like transmembrane component-domain-containing protein [Flammula alnicola]|nr:ferric reductase like transmembrane component-domain-containing protein [Flammula alnicola]
MADTGTPPVIPIEFQQYNSYLVDPQWQRKFSIVWSSALAFFVVLSLPYLVRSIRNGRAYSTLFGISEGLTGKEYAAISVSANGTSRRRSTVSPGLARQAEKVMGIFGSIFYWMLPGIGLNAGQILIITGYIVLVVLCIVLDAPLVSNSNRAGFIALAQFPIVFLFATKNSIVSLLLGPGNGYEKLNFIHRWSGRIMFLGAVLHGSLWIRNHLQYDLPILGQQKETSGVASLGLLGVIVLTSLRPVRRFCYEIFYIIHMLSFIAFFVTICYHTLYAAPYIFPPMAFYGLDILMRMVRHRIKDAVLVPIGNQMTLIHVPYATSGWIAGQHVRLRVFFSGRIFESHPLSIFSAPPDVSCITSMPQGLSLGARAIGDWTKALNQYALQTASEIRTLSDEKGAHHVTQEVPVEIPVQVMLDGPYGGCSVDLGHYETALLFAGGSGITFTLGVLDDIVGRCVRKGRLNGERTKRIEFAWCVRSFGSIDWFAPALMDIANVAASSSTSSTPLDLHISIYVTCLCNPEAVLPIPNCDVTIIRPSVYRVLRDLTDPRKPASKGELPTTHSDMNVNVGSKLPCVEDGGGLAVCASGPEGLIREAANAVARIQMSGRGGELGGVGLHTEIFTL